MADLNEIIHQPTRLRIMAALVALNAEDQMDFGGLQRLLSLTEGNLGAHLLKLEEAGYLRVEKLFIERRPKTLLAVTLAGRKAFENHVAALKQLIAEPAQPVAHETNTARPKPAPEPPSEPFQSPAEVPFLD